MKSQNINEKEEEEDDKIEIKYIDNILNDQKIKLLIFSKYSFIYEVRNLILHNSGIEDHIGILAGEYVLIFYGKKMDIELRLLHYNIDLFKNEIIYLTKKINENERYGIRKIKVVYDNQLEIFYVDSFHSLKYNISKWLNVPPQNLLLLRDGKDKIEHNCFCCFDVDSYINVKIITNNPFNIKLKVKEEYFSKKLFPNYLFINDYIITINKFLSMKDVLSLIEKQL